MEQQQKIFTKRFISLFFTNMAVFFVFYGLVTTLPLYAIGELGRSDDESGLLVTVFLLSAIIMRPFSGKLLDLYGKKRLLVISLAFYLLCTILYVFFKPFVLLLVLRFFQGIWFSIATTSPRYRESIFYFQLPLRTCIAWVSVFIYNRICN